MEPLLEPFQLKHLSLRNRIFSSAHAPALVESGHPRERYIRYHEEKARGGVALTMIGGSTNIAPDSPSVFGQLYAGDDSILPWFGQLTERVKRHGSAIMCQLTHMGRRTAWDRADWLPVLAPSAVRERAHRAYPKVMEHADIQRVIDDFAKAAQRCQLSGFDGIELLCHAHLLGQFLSPLTNFREDDYGGCLENRLRLTIEVLQAVRSVVGSEFIVGLRFTGDELIEAGLSQQECIAAAQLLSATGQVDFLNILAGAPYDDLGLTSWVAPMGVPSAAHLDIAWAMRQAVDLPILHAGGIADIATARHAISEGKVDMVGMTRAQIADPYLVEKLTDGRELDIRPCVGLGYCVDRVNQGADMLCGHNPVTGREQRFSHRIPLAQENKKVLVVGGGPAGLEAARVCAERGHSVTLYEATDKLGGQLTMAAKSLTRRQIAGVVDWLAQQLQKLEVQIHYNHFVEAPELLEQAPDVILLATGGWPELPSIPGAQWLYSSWQVLSGEVRPQGRVLVFDEPGDHPGSSCAELLARSGCDVVMASPDRAISQQLGPTNYSVVLAELTKLGVQFESLTELQALEKTGRLNVCTASVLTGQQQWREFDAVVVENALQPSDELYFELKAQSRNEGVLDREAMVAGSNPFVSYNDSGRYWLARLGDCVAPRNIHAALFDATRVCHKL